MNCEEKDLFQKCQDIISDGKLSEDDVRQLSEYINASPNASDTLIGKQLVGPLQKVWVDGVVDEGELNMLAGLLISIVHPEPPSGVSSTAGITVSSLGSSVIMSTTDSDPVAAIITGQRQEQQEILDGLKGAFKLMNQRNISRDELDEAEKNIRTSSKVIFDLKDKVIKRKVIIGFVEEQITNLLGGEDKDTQDWRKFFKKRPSKALVKNCAIQAITSSDQGDAMEIMVELIRREQAIQPVTQAGGGRYSVKKMLKPVNFYYHSPDARKVCIVGDFNDWKPDAHPMKRKTGGFWNAQITLPHGHHRYHFLVDGTVALDPRANGEVLNDIKERVSLIAVS
tara:strand:- start:327 stop:1343 length:1017 start_codon:yes stop_codon:yes gene_type:complete